MDGFCPVSLVQQTRWVKGDERWGAYHRGRTYLMSSQADQQKFLADPDRFSPALSGYDPVRFAETRQLVNGKREYGVFFANTYYLFSDESALVKFESQPQGYVQVVRQAMANSGPIPPQR
jgi:protein disulfide-isomerase